MNGRSFSQLCNPGSLARCFLLLLLTAVACPGPAHGEEPEETATQRTAGENQPGREPEEPGVAAEAKPAAGSRPEDIALRERVEALIAQWGSNEFAEREAATRELTALGEKLLWEPDIEADLANVEQFHYCFILPLWEASRLVDREVAQRAKYLFSQYCGEFPIGAGVECWALYAACRLEKQLPALCTDKELLEQMRLVPNREDKELLRWSHACDAAARSMLHKLTVIHQTRQRPRAFSEWTLLSAKRQGHPPFLLNLTLAIWAQSDFPAAWKWALTHQPELAPGCITGMLRKWPRDWNADVAADAVRGELVIRGEIPRDVYELVARLYAERDMEKALGWYNEVPPDVRSRAARAIADTIAQKEISAAIAFARRLPPGRDRNSAVDAIASAMADSDAHFCTSLLELVTTAASKDRFRAFHVKRLAQDDRAAAIEEFSRIEDPTIRMNAASWIVAPWSMSEPERAARWLNSVSNTTNIAAGVPEVAAAWADLEPAAAIDYADQLSDAATKCAAYRAIARRLASTKFDLALELMTRETPPEHSSYWSLRTEVFDRWAKCNPHGAAEWLDCEGRATGIAPWHRTLGQSFARHDMRAAAKWMISLRNDESRFFACIGISNYVTDDAHSD